MMLCFDHYRPRCPEDQDLEWAIGSTARTSFVWTITPKWTEFSGRYDLVEDNYLCIFKWTDPLWSAIDIMIDEDFICFLGAGHTRKDYNRYYLGQDFDYIMAPPGVEERPLPLGNHVISVCLEAGIIHERPKGHFFLRADWSSKSRWRQIDLVTEALQKNLKKVKVSREEIENHSRYLEKQAMADRYWNRVLNAYAKIIWNQAHASKMEDIPQSELFRNLITKKLHGNPPAKNRKEARWIVREAWKAVRKNITDRIKEKLMLYSASGHGTVMDKDTLQALILEARQDVLCELEADLKKDDSQ